MNPLKLFSKAENALSNALGIQKSKFQTTCKQFNRNYQTMIYSLVFRGEHIHIR